MAQFLIDQAVDIDNTEEEEDQEEEEEQNEESNFIDDDSFFEDQMASNYRLVKDSFENFEESSYSSSVNVTIGPEEAMALTDSEDEQESELTNFVHSNEPFPERILEYDESKVTETRFKKFYKSLKQKCEKIKDSFFNAVMWGVYSKIKDVKIDHLFNYEQGKLEKALGQEFANKFIHIKEAIHLDINFMTFERKMHLVNDLLFEKNVFLRLYEKKSKFRYLFRKGHDKNKLQKEASSCVEQRYNGFHVTEHMCAKIRQIEFTSVDIVYEPVKRMDQIIECYFTNEINEAFIRRFQHYKNDILRSSTAFLLLL